jgi:predicted nucleotidyltransferase component of viral defense system
MGEIPLILKLRRNIHKNIALAQDLVVNEVYKVFDTAILHGGTALWRCYSGNRFSEDVDIYIKKDLKKINLLFDKLQKAGFKISKKKISENSIYSALVYNGTIVRLEALFKNTKGFLKEYLTSDGNMITCYTLTPEELIIEKAGTYLKRRKVRDLYDVFFLLRHAKINERVKSSLQELVEKFKEPVDEENLRVIIIEGVVPSSESMLNRIKREL